MTDSPDTSHWGHRPLGPGRTSLPVHSAARLARPAGLLARAARAPRSLSYRTGGSAPKGLEVPAPGRGPCAPPRALCQPPTHRGASLTFRYCCGSSLSCGGATGRSGRGSVSSACQGLCVPSFYGVPRACPLKRITRLAVNLGGGGGTEKGHTRHPRRSGPHTPLPAYHSGPTECQRLREPSRAGPGAGRGGAGRHSLGLAAPLQPQQLPLLLLVLPLDLRQPHPEVQLHGVHVLQGRLHGVHLGGDGE